MGASVAELAEVESITSGTSVVEPAEGEAITSVSSRASVSVENDQRAYVSSARYACSTIVKREIH